MVKSKTTRRVVGIATLFALFTTLAVTGCKRDKAISVTTEKVARRDLIELIPANGRIQPVVQVVISPEVAGEIVALPARI